MRVCMYRAVCRGVVELLVSVLGDVLFELGFCWKEGGRLLCGVFYRVCECW